MTLRKKAIQELSNAAIRAVRLAGNFIAKQSGQSIIVERKEGSESEAFQVVTEVDRQAQQIILDELDPTIATYDLGLLTEESVDNKSRFIKDYFWCIDPLDGTLPFIESTPGYSVSIALVNKQGVSDLGVIYDPVNDVLFKAIKGEGAFRNDQTFQIQPDESAEKFTFITDRSFLKHPRYQDILKELGILARDRKLSVISHGGAAMNACWVVEDPPAVYFKPPKSSPGGGSVWDFAASSCIVKEAGGVVTDIFGDMMDLNKKGDAFMNRKGILYASDKLIAEFVKHLSETLGK